MRKLAPACASPSGRGAAGASKVQALGPETAWLSGSKVGVRSATSGQARTLRARPRCCAARCGWALPIGRGDGRPAPRSRLRRRGARRASRRPRATGRRAACRRSGGAGGGGSARRERRPPRVDLRRSRGDQRRGELHCASADRCAFRLGQVGEAGGMAARDDQEVAEIRVAAVGQRRDVEGHRELFLPEQAAGHGDVPGDLLADEAVRRHARTVRAALGPAGRRPPRPGFARSRRTPIRRCGTSAGCRGTRPRRQTRGARRTPAWGRRARR